MTPISEGKALAFSQIRQTGCKKVESLFHSAASSLFCDLPAAVRVWIIREVYDWLTSIDQVHVLKINRIEIAKCWPVVV